MIAKARRRNTQTGLGTAGDPTQQRVTTKLAAEQPHRATLPMPTGVDAPDLLVPPSPPLPAVEERATPVPVSGTRARASREPVSVDQVGEEAVRLGSTPPLSACPRVVVGMDEIVTLLVDSREAFLVSLVDGRSSITTLVDASGIREEDVVAMLMRLRRLGVLELR